ncbi:hypothetical protein BO99DRAFT_413703 [Aspergillus violaceofuscus CBS 115571]|uniref:Uncharacterized protein n=1 Tax=Aspergillus violaceofuscus (strain CBS 115571) TaxID=1450538 RepID=A0A2V5I1S9_ASPV1|nr:hypothetical protein BO99DRAFT_413703 [Aspergillus violaceofuscus CBS 115571]
MASKNTSAQSGSGLAPLSDAKSKRMYQAAREYIRTCRDERYDPLWEAVTEVYVYGPFPQWEEIITSLLHHEHKEIARPFGEERNELMASNNSQRLHWIMDCVPAPLGIIGVFLDLNPPLNWGLSFVTALAAWKPEVAVAMVAREEQFTKRSSILKNEVKAAADFGYPCVMQAIFDRKDHSRPSCDSIRESRLKTAQLIAYERERRHRKAGLMVSGVLTPLRGGAYRLVCQTTDPSNSSAPSRKSLVFYLDRRCISATEREERALFSEAERKIESDDV